MVFEPTSPERIMVPYSALGLRGRPTCVMYVSTLRSAIKLLTLTTVYGTDSDSEIVSTKTVELSLSARVL